MTFILAATTFITLYSAHLSLADLNALPADEHHDHAILQSMDALLLWIAATMMLPLNAKRPSDLFTRRNKEVTKSSPETGL